MDSFTSEKPKHDILASQGSSLYQVIVLLSKQIVSWQSSLAVMLIFIARVVSGAKATGIPSCMSFLKSKVIISEPLGSCEYKKYPQMKYQNLLI